LTRSQLGNNRGNKYSKKSTKYAPTEARFWAFSIDQFAFHDIPDSITYILSTTNQPSLSYVGFSQGTAQAFATLSIHPNLNDKVDVFVALAPAMSPPGLTSRLVNSLIKASPDFIFLAFGRRAILSSATMWEALLYPPIFVRFVDIGTHFLFGWHNQNMTAHQKLAAYPKLYSFTSTKSVVHWFQIIRNGKFQMYDDEMQGPLSISDTSKYYKVAKFPTRNIKTPIVMLYGGRDSLVNIGVMLKELPKHTEAREIAHYEHLDFLWASDVHEQVFPHVFEALERYAGGKRDVASQTARPNTPAPATGASNTSSRVVDDTTSATEDEPGPRKHTQNILHPSSSSSRPPAVAAKWPSGTRIPVPATSSPTTVSGSNAATDRTSTSRPEGWWSSDEVAGTEPSTPAKPSTSSVSSVAVPPPLGGASLALGTKGVGVGGVSGGKGERSDSGSSLMSGGGGRKRRKKRRGDEGDEE
jgi:lysosomal acid lipase/cholesteryl ester hydrolase